MVLEGCSSEVSWAGCQVGDYAEQGGISLYNLVFLCLHQSLKSKGWSLGASPTLIGQLDTDTTAVTGTFLLTESFSATLGDW